MSKSPMVELRVRGFFTSDATGMNLAPAISIVCHDHAKVADAVQAIADKFSNDEGVPSRILETIAGKGFMDKVDVSDWRFMTPDEVAEYREDE